MRNIPQWPGFVVPLALVLASCGNGQAEVLAESPSVSASSPSIEPDGPGQDRSSRRSSPETPEPRREGVSEVQDLRGIEYMEPPPLADRTASLASLSAIDPDRDLANVAQIVETYQNYLDLRVAARLDDQAFADFQNVASTRDIEVVADWRQRNALAEDTGVEVGTLANIAHPFDIESYGDDVFVLSDCLEERATGKRIDLSTVDFSTVETTVEKSDDGGFEISAFESLDSRTPCTPPVYESMIRNEMGTFMHLFSGIFADPAAGLGQLREYLEQESVQLLGDALQQLVNDGSYVPQRQSHEIVRVVSDDGMQNGWFEVQTCTTVHEELGPIYKESGEWSTNSEVGGRIPAGSRLIRDFRVRLGAKDNSGEPVLRVVDMPTTTIAQAC